MPDGTIVHLQLLLTRDPQVQAAFEQRLADQQNPSSPLFHQWLTPTQIGQLYGLVPSDLDAVTSWLNGTGLHVDAVAPSGTFIQASGSAATVAAAFGTPLHRYSLPSAAGDGRVRAYRAPTDEPSVPTALVPVIGAVGGLDEIPSDPQSHDVSMAGQSQQPLFTAANGNHSMSPADFATIYDINPVYNAGITGTGYRVAIIGRSQVNPADISTFETIFNLPARVATVVVPPLGTDPGQTNDGDQSEATLDVERVLGTAPGAQADLVVSSGTGGGVLTAISYNVQTLLDPIMTTSFGGGCEAVTTKSDTLLEAGLFAQAAAEGISTFASGGDSGAADCDMHGVAPPANPTNPISINAFCASGFVTCVGGTEFADTANPSAYWSATNTNKSSALGYIPEGAWNDPFNANTNTYLVSSGGGGTSIYFPKPDFQIAAGVIPTDKMRDTPDISFSASPHDGYIVCYSNAPGGPCTMDSSGNITFSTNSGTSASAPSMAGIAALIDQKLGGAQGNFNPLIYRIATKSYSTAFHDATPASSGVPAANCVTSMANMCNNSVPSTTSVSGGQAGFLLATGYDQATGWGSLDVANFLNAATSTGAASTAKLTGSSGTFTGTQTLTFNMAVAGTGSSTVPTGTVQFFVNGFPSGSAVTLNSAGQATYMVSSTTLSSVTTTTFGAFQVTATYSGDSNFEGSNSNVLSLTLNPTGTTSSTLTFAATPNPTSPTQSVTFTVTFMGNGSTAPVNDVGIFNVNGGTLERFYFQPLTNNQLTYTTSGLTAGTHKYIAMYAGDGTYAPVSSAMLSLVSTALPTTTTLSGPTTANPGTASALSATVAGVFANTAAASTTVIHFVDGTTLIGAIQPVFPTSSSTNTTSGTATLNVTLAAGTHSITAVWPGDGTSSTSTSSPLIVISAAPGVSYSAAAPSITVAAGSAASDVLTLTSVGGYSGSANLSCTVTYSGTQSVNFAPTCSLSSSTLTLAAGGTANSTLSIATTAPHAVSGDAQALLHKPGGTTGFGTKQKALFYAVLLCLPIMVGRRKRRRVSQLLSLMIVLACGSLLATVAGCSSAGAPLVGTTTGQYTVTVSGGAGTTSAALGTISLTVQ